jgi:hydrophobe/amphiphile efflux-3 (HAE3) family protein
MHRLTAICLEWPRATLAAVLLMSIAAALGAVRVQSETGYRAALGRDHPEVRRLDRFIRDFGGGLPVVVAWGCEVDTACQGALDQRSLRMARDLAETIRNIEGVRRVHSPATAPLVLPSGDTRRLLEGDAVPADLAELLESAARDPLWQGTLISEDGRAAALIVQLDSSDPREHDLAVRALLDQLAPFEEEGFRFALVGDPIDFVVGGGELSKEPKKLGAFTVGLILLTLWILFRSPLAPLPALTTVGLAALWTLGIMGWAGWPETEISQAMVPLLLVVGVCDSLHFLVRYGDTRPGEDGADPSPRRERLILAARDLSWPCVLTSLTTAAGFASFVTSDLASFLRFGLAASLGILFALLLTFSLLPVLVDLLRVDISTPRSSPTWKKAMALVTRASERRPGAILVGAAMLVAISAYGVSELRVDVSKESLMGSGSPIVRWQRWVESNLRRPDTLEVRLNLPPDAALSDPEVFAQLQRVSAFLEAHPNLGETRSLLEPLSRVNEIVHDGDPSFFRPGESGEQNEQLLFALVSFDSSSFEQWSSSNRRHLRISVEAELLPKTERMAVIESVDEFLAGSLPEGWSHELTGPFRLFAEMVEGIHSTQTRSFSVAALLIAILVGLGLRSVAAAAWVMVPTLFPVVITLGAMGLMGVALDTGTAMIAAIVLGIAVDDSVHLVSRFQRGQREGASSHEAMRRAVSEVGRPVVASSFALSIGFLSLLLSSWGAIAAFGFLSAVAIMVALAADLLLLPAILFVFVESPELSPSARERLGRSALKGAGRAGMIALVVGALCGQLVLVGVQVAGESNQVRPLCEALPNGVVPLNQAVTPGCPLRAYEIVSFDDRPPRLGQASFEAWPMGRERRADPAFAVSANRSGRNTVVKLPATSQTRADRRHAFAFVFAITGLLLLVCVTIFWHSAAAAALPLLIGCASLSAVAIASVLGGVSAAARFGGVIGLSLTPAAAAHLAVTFPMERPILRVAPFLGVAIYIAGAVLMGVAIVSYARFPEIFALVSQVAIASSVLAGLALLIGCAAAARKSGSVLERTRARVLLMGLGGVLALGALVQGMDESVLLKLPGNRAGAFAFTMLGLLLPVAYAVHRYQLFDLRRNALGAVRFAALAIVFLVLTMGIGAALPGLSMGASASLPLAALLAWCLTELVREGVWESVARRISLRAERARLLGNLHARRMQTLPTRNQILQDSIELLQRGTGAAFATIFLRTRGGWFLGAASGRGITEESFAEIASELTPTSESIHLAREEVTQSEAHDALRDRAVEVLVPVEGASERLAMILLGASRRDPYSSQELEFANTVAAQLAVALSWSRAADELGAVESMATRGTIAASLAHDIGKPIGVVWATARSMLDRGEMGEEQRRQVERMQQRADDALGIVDQLMEQSRRSGRDQELRPLGEVVSRAIVEIETRYPHRIPLRLSPGLPEIRFSFELHQAMLSLLDNACRATEPGDLIEVYVNLLDQLVVIEVVDSGIGMDSETRQRAFEPWFTTRFSREGYGLGLALCRSILRQVGGDVEIVASEPEKGTRMRIGLNLAEEG